MDAIFILSAGIISAVCYKCCFFSSLSLDSKKIAETFLFADVKSKTRHFYVLCMVPSSGSSGRVEGGPRNMKSMRSNSVTIFFMTFFYRAGGGGMAPSAPPGSATGTKKIDIDGVCKQNLMVGYGKWPCNGVLSNLQDHE